MVLLHVWLQIFISVSACRLVCSSINSEIRVWSSSSVAKWIEDLLKDYIAAGFDSLIESVQIQEGNSLLFDKLLQDDQIDFHADSVNALVSQSFPLDQAILPIGLSLIAIAVNLPNITSLSLTAETMMMIFNGTCQSWNHYLIQQDNPNVALPREPIVIVKRADRDASTEVLTSFFGKASRDWDMLHGSRLPSLPNDIVTNGTLGIVAETIAREYSLTYVSSHALKSTSLIAVSIKNEYSVLVSLNNTPDIVDFPDSNHIPELLRRSFFHYPLAEVFIIRIPRFASNLGIAMRRVRFLLWMIERFLTRPDAMVKEYELLPLIKVKRDMLLLDSIQVRNSPEEIPLQAVLNTRACLIGESRLTTSSPVFYIDILNRVLPSYRSPYNDTTCNPCPPGTYNIDRFSGVCDPCPRDARCPGGHYIFMPQNTWAGSYLSNGSVSIWVAPCQHQLQSCCPDRECMVDPKPGSSTACRDLFTGPGCSQCIPGYTHWMTSCYNCNISSLSEAGQILAFVLINIMLSLFFMFSPQMSEMIYVETFVFHYQIGIRLLHQMSLWTKVNQVWAGNTFSFLTGLEKYDTPGLILFPALSCRFGDSQITWAILSQCVFIVFYMTPTLIITVAGPFWLNYRKKKPNLGEASTSPSDVFADPERDRAFLMTLRRNGAFRIIYLSITPVLYQSLSAMKCFTNPIDGSQVLSLALSEKCWTKHHMDLYFLAIFLTFMLLVVVPVIVNRELTKPEHMLNAHDPAYNLMSHMRKRYRIYRPVIVAHDHVFEKFLLIFGMVFAPEDPFAVIFCFAFIVLIRFSFQFYSRHSDNVLRLASIVSLAALSVISLGDAFQKNPYQSTIVCLVLILTCPLICLVMFINDFAFRRKLRNKIVPMVKRHLNVQSTVISPVNRTKHLSIMTHSSVGRKLGLSTIR